jgi:RHS repeat-associated protein
VTAGGVTIKYLIDDLNPTGYAQVVEEFENSTLKKQFTYGHKLISQRQISSGTVNFYGYDGHGSVRLLTDVSGAVTDRIDYDAFGIIVGISGSTSNNYLYTGEQFDTNISSYYLRARYYNQAQGRFFTKDTFSVQKYNPIELNRYVYVANSPTNFIDPTGTNLIKYSTSIIKIAGQVALRNKGAILKFIGLQLVNVGLPILLDSIIPHARGVKGSGAGLSHSELLRKNLGGQNITKVQAHHLVPTAQAQSSPFIARAIRAGWNNDAEYNGILLPNNDADSASLGLPKHVGYHKTYSIMVGNELTRLEVLAQQNNWSDQDCYNILKAYAGKLEQFVRARGIVGVPTTMNY